MSRLISKWEANPADRGYAEVMYDPKEEQFYVDLFDAGGLRYFTIDRPNQALQSVEEEVQAWAERGVLFPEEEA